jgi:hypothetical protein
MKPILLIAATIIFFSSANAQKTLQAVRTSSRITIDGDIKDDAWKQAPAASSFIEWRPAFGNTENEQTKTEVWLLYDDEAIYIGGFCHERADSISKELVGRDVVGVNDFVGVIFDTYLDKVNGFGYYVTALGEQYDAKYSSRGEDGSWSSVWNSAAKIVDGGWTFEMKIPYSAIRFSNKNIQNWGMNITRRRNKTSQQFMWSPTDPNISGFLGQFGQLQNIQNIKPPLRLSFSPYLSTYLDHYPYNQPGKKNFSSTINGGMDVKYGISKGFTLDMTLIPDFGQVQSDNQVLNLSPFEVKYNENRSFFTEGTELFNKGNLFYSRRIGGTPMRYYNYSVGQTLGTGEVVVKNPSVTKLINATKVSGRTAGGLGIGFFNAIANATYAVVEDGAKNQREIETNPLTNYNIIVFDQSLKHNSSVSFINANTWRSGKDYDANVSAFMWDVYDKKIMFNVNGKVAVSQLIGYTADNKNLNGYMHSVGFGKVSGRFNFNISQELANEKYQQNDLGFFNNNNYLDHYWWFGYKWTQPKNWYKRLYLNYNGYYSRRFKPSDYQTFTSNVNLNGTLKNLWDFGVIVDIKPEAQSFYEPRIAGKMFKNPGTWMKGFWIGTNRAKKYSANFEVYNRKAFKNDYMATDFWISQRYRFNDKISIGLSSSIQPRINQRGFAFIPSGSDSSIFAVRDVRTVENTFNTKYNFNNRMGITLRVRHYLSKVENKKFYNLENDGYLKEIATPSKNYNYNVNFFNVDMVYTWQFAPGSFFNIVWKDAGQFFSGNAQTRYFKNLNNTLDEPQANSISLKVIWYIDYLSLRKKRS